MATPSRGWAPSQDSKYVFKRPPSTRFCSFGTVGSGKTTFAIAQLLRYRRDYPELKIFSNVELEGVNYTPIRKAGFLFTLNEPCFVLLDELWHMADSRKGLSVLNDIMTALLLRSRRLGWWVGYTEQWYTQVDLRIRFVTDVWAGTRLYGPVLRAGLFTVFGEEIGDKWYDARPAWDHFDSSKDPLTLDLDELQAAYEAYEDRRLGRVNRR